MLPQRCSPPLPATALLALLLACLTSWALAQDTARIKGYGIDGKTRELDVSRYPALYTGDFDDCLGGESLFNVTKFDAAYYADNLTVLFHLDGSTNIRSENLILHISVEAYGENRFNMTYDPCKANIATMCPLNATVPVTAFAVIPISPTDVAGIPSIALGIPDLEGFARLQIFANSTQTEIGCFQAVMTNGNSFSQPQYVGTIMGVFTLLAVLASFATAIYGLSIPHMRTHYAHSFSVLVIFETFQSIFFSGALTVNWPSVLPAWWSNFAWSAAMFASDTMVRSISSFAGTNANISQVGGAGSVQINNGGGLSQQIYGRSLAPLLLTQRSTTPALAPRQSHNASNPYDYTWNGRPRTPGMPMPGTWPGFAGTLSLVNVPPTEAFMIGFIWFLVVVAIVAFSVASTKFLLDWLIRLNLVKTDGFDFFRSHLPGYLGAALLRTLFIAFFTMMTLAMYQFSLHGPAGPTAIAAIVWTIFLVVVGGTAIYACRYRLREGSFETASDRIRIEHGALFNKVPFVVATRESNLGHQERTAKRFLIKSLPFFRIRYRDRDPYRSNVHQDQAYVKRFGWLSARYRRTRWWFFAVYVGYLFIRACFVGGGSRTPLAQVFGLFIFEILALLAIIKMSPFEGNRNTALAVWILSISKIVTTGLSIAFLPDFGLSRIVATVLGIIIIVVQGFLAVAVLVLIAVGIVSSCMSLSRNRQEFAEALDQTRIQYFEHIQARAADLPPPPRVQIEETQEIRPYFNVKDVRRAPKIEDEDGQGGAAGLVPGPPSIAGPSSAAASIRRSRANSASSRCSANSLARGTRPHRTSWSSKDFAQWDAEMSRGDVQRSRSGSLRLHPIGQDAPRIMVSAARRPPLLTPMRESFEGPMLAMSPASSESPGGNNVSLVVDKIAESTGRDMAQGASSLQEGACPQPTTASTCEPLDTQLDTRGPDVASLSHGSTCAAASNAPLPSSEPDQGSLAHMDSTTPEKKAP
ncbi:hypothetical protein CDD82_3653 [Ophiocordyceps australis]|uniref:ML-like domain-containing protein n=1 Tax=Ophiocordyceps australis TaxID=1399860 RepID=A0A2C5ZB70_9HYPO|nr:hypothetical protein CDD82_3653 [Ophiocordyceps australis]